MSGIPGDVHFHICSVFSKFPIRNMFYFIISKELVQIIKKKKKKSGFAHHVHFLFKALLQLCSPEASLKLTGGLLSLLRAVRSLT